MILDHISSAARYHALHPLLEAAFTWLATHDHSQLAVGRNSIGDYGDSLYAMLNLGQGQGPGNGAVSSEVVSEAHRRYIDIHFTLEGIDAIGCLPAAMVSQRKTDFDEANDYELFTDAPLNISTIPPGHFAVYFPEDVHAPNLGTELYRKIVVKVAVA